MKCRLARGVCGLLLIAGLGGCRDPDPQLEQLAAQVTHEQAQQNERIAESARALAEGSQQLVSADAQARRELIDLQQALRHDQTEIARQRDALEAERQAIARQRRTDSAIGSSVVFAVWLLAGLSPLVLAAMALLVAHEMGEN